MSEIVCRTVDDFPEYFTLQSTENNSVFIIKPSIVLLSDVHFTKNATLQNQGFYTIDMNTDTNLVQMLEKIRVSVGAYLWSMVVGNIDMDVDIQNILSKTLSTKERLIKSSINQG